MKGIGALLKSMNIFFIQNQPKQLTSANEDKYIQDMNEKWENVLTLT